MKKIVALALSLVMVLGLATTAFAAIPVWTTNGATVDVDLFDGTYNTKVATGEMVFNVAKAPVYNAAGDVVTPGNVAYYVFTDKDGNTAVDPYELVFYVMVDSIPADANAADYVLVKVADPKVEIGAVMDEYNQTAASQVSIMKMVKGVQYSYTASLFSAWGNLCGQFKAPADVATQKYATWTAKGVESLTAVNVATDNTWTKNVLIGNEVYAVAGAALTKTPHAWAPSAWNEKTGAVTEYTCANCKTVAKVINASVNAPAGSTVENLGGVLIAFTYTPGVAGSTGSTVESAQTFDAGIAMYVGMSVMAAAGSAVVLKKKD